MAPEIDLFGELPKPDAFDSSKIRLTLAKWSEIVSFVSPELTDRGRRLGSQVAEALRSTAPDIERVTELQAEAASMLCQVWPPAMNMDEPSAAVPLEVFVSSLMAVKSGVAIQWIYAIYEVTQAITDSRLSQPQIDHALKLFTSDLRAALKPSSGGSNL